MEKIIAEVARDLRKNQTEAEELLWKCLRSKKLGFKFRRQEPIGKFIADFVCFEKMLIVELDGGQHRKQAGRDRERGEWLEAQGFTIIRFWNSKVTDDLAGTIEAIKSKLA